jgi:hypothetical protein
VGSRKGDAISRDLVPVWVGALANHGPNSNAIPAAAMSAAILQQHYEKHCCNQHANNAPDEGLWWARTLRYDITRADLLAAGIVITANAERELFPYGGDAVNNAGAGRRLVDHYINPALVARLYAAYGNAYKTHIEAQYLAASKAFVMFHGGKIQIAARKGLFFFMATYNRQHDGTYLLELMSSYSPNDLNDHWNNNLTPDKLWDIKV